MALTPFIPPIGGGPINPVPRGPYGIYPGPNGGIPKPGGNPIGIGGIFYKPYVMPFRFNPF